MAKPDQGRAPLSITWAIDPFSKERNLQRSAARVISQFLERCEAHIRPVYVVQNDIWDLNEVERAALEKRAGEVVQASFEVVLGGLLRNVCSPVTVLGSKKGSINARVEVLLEDCRKNKTDFIVAGTHARTGATRLFMGSFAETLSLVSDIPLLLVNPMFEGDRSFEHILFATDLSKQSRLVWGRLVPIAAALRSRITVLHKIGTEISPQLESFLNPAAYFANILTEQRRSARDDTEEWAEQARVLGLEVKVVIDEATNVSIADSILSHSETSPGLIALAGQSSVIDTALLGSISRRVIREARCPVWILHSPPAPAEEAKKGAATRDARVIAPAKDPTVWMP